MNGEAKLGEQRSGDCRIIRPYSNWCVDTLRQYPNETGVKIVRLEEGYIKKTLSSPSKRDIRVEDRGIRTEPIRNRTVV